MNYFKWEIGAHYQKLYLKIIFFVLGISHKYKKLKKQGVREKERGKVVVEDRFNLFTFLFSVIFNLVRGILNLRYSRFYFSFSVAHKTKIIWLRARILSMQMDAWFMTFSQFLFSWRLNTFLWEWLPYLFHLLFNLCLMLNFYTHFSLIKVYFWVL